MARERTGIMLAYPYEEKRLDKWLAHDINILLQPKYEGDRCRALTGPGGGVTLLSSSARVIDSVPHINAALEDLNFAGIEFDGELYIHGMPHQDIRSIVSRTQCRHPEYYHMEYHIYDIVDEQKEMRARILHLTNLFKDLPKKSPIKLAPTWLASAGIIWSVYDQLLEQEYEGVIFRKIDGLYKRKRSTEIMKLKPRLSGIYKITGMIEEQTIGGVLKKTLGALCLEDDEGRPFKVGSGFTKDQRDKLWKQDLTGKWAKIRYQSLTNDNIPKMQSFVEIVGSEQHEDD